MRDKRNKPVDQMQQIKKESKFRKKRKIVRIPPKSPKWQQNSREKGVQITYTEVKPTIKQAPNGYQNSWKKSH